MTCQCLGRDAADVKLGWREGPSGLLATRVVHLETARLLRVRRLEDLDPSDLAAATAVAYETKGTSSHAEVVCRIRGIPLVASADVAELRRSACMSLATQEFFPHECVTAFGNHRGGFQAVISAADDIPGLDFDRIQSVFLRMEHLLYWAHRTMVSNPLEDRTLVVLLQEHISKIRDLLPARVRLVVRGLDVRSDDLSIGHHFHGAPETNPEIGLHGVRWLLSNPEWVQKEAEILRGDLHNTTYAAPFVASLSDYTKFCNRYARHLPDIIPFIEAPAALHALGRFPDGPVSVGLKDIAQMFFAADRTSQAVAAFINYCDPSLIDFIRSSIGHGPKTRRDVAIFQDRTTLAAYAKILGRSGWLPSMSAAEIKLLQSGLRFQSRTDEFGSQPCQ